MQEIWRHLALYIWMSLSSINSSAFSLEFYTILTRQIGATMTRFIRWDCSPICLRKWALTFLKENNRRHRDQNAKEFRKKFLSRQLKQDEIATLSYHRTIFPSSTSFSKFTFSVNHVNAKQRIILWIILFIHFSVNW